MRGLLLVLVCLLIVPAFAGEPPPEIQPTACDKALNACEQDVMRLMKRGRQKQPPCKEVPCGAVPCDSQPCVEMGGDDDDYVPEGWLVDVGGGLELDKDFGAIGMVNVDPPWTWIPRRLSFLAAATYHDYASYGNGDDEGGDLKMASWDEEPPVVQQHKHDDDEWRIYAGMKWSFGRKGD